MERTLEPELMLDPHQAFAYASADFSTAHQAVIERFAAIFSAFNEGLVLDMGCGTADISIRFAKRFPRAKIIGVDGSPSMLSIGRKRIEEYHLSHSIELFEGIIPTWSYPAPFDVLLSNSLLHHLPRLSIAWQAIKKYAKKGAFIFFVDLIRPESIEKARLLTESYVQNAPFLLKRDFFNSLLASFTIEEISQEIQSKNLSFTVEQISDFHLMIHGIFNG
ncbi:SAM-dependent methyltransferase [Methylacidiphilum sp. Yel]|uniref:methyltransferase domain-containing protein n=1 Tax=Methylacidiphilum sp. Yel TaxID=1847730 RepID=UPI0010690B94|nr:methyltransferase domain-containing protein [Methylacidiphilum sp. Yel]TFE66760.1 SAM-dependent methyltransferase [Methylacidiphilum sp. Yel]